MATIKKREMVLALYTGDPDAGLETALVRAGYSKSRAAITACEFRRDPEFIAALERKQAKLAQKAERGELTDAEVINGIRDIDDECKAAGAVASYLTIRLKAHELLCKIKGMFIEKIEFGFGAELAKEIEAARQRARTPVMEAPMIEATITKNRELN
jgi:hypothetical protein